MSKSNNHSYILSPGETPDRCFVLVYERFVSRALAHSPALHPSALNSASHSPVRLRRSLVSERHHGVHGNCPARRNRAGRPGHRQQECRQLLTISAYAPIRFLGATAVGSTEASSGRRTTESAISAPWCTVCRTTSLSRSWHTHTGAPALVHHKRTQSTEKEISSSRDRPEDGGAPPREGGFRGLSLLPG